MHYTNREAAQAYCYNVHAGEGGFLALNNTRGFAKLHFAAFSCFAATTFVFSPNLSIFDEMGFGGAQLGYFVFPMFIAIVVLAACGLVYFRKKQAAAQTSMALLGGATLVYVTTCCLFLAFIYGFEASLAFTTVVGACYGASLALLSLAWARILGRCEFKEALLYGTLVCLFSYLLSLGLMVIQEGVRWVFFLLVFLVGALMPIAVFWAEQHAGNAPRPAEDSAELAENTKGKESSADLLATLRLPIVGLLLFVFMMAINKNRVFDRIDSEYAGGIIAALLILPLFALRTEKPLASLLYRVIAPAIGGLVVVLLAFPAGTALHGIAIQSVYVFLSALAILAFANILAIIHAGEFSPEFVTSAGLLAGGLVSLAGIGWTRVYGGPEDMEPIVLVLIALYCAFMMIYLGWESWVMVNQPVGERSAAAPNDAWIERAQEAKLTKREIEVLGYLGRGHSIIYIAEKLFISESTVRTHVKHIYNKLGIHAREELFAFVDGTDANA